MITVRLIILCSILLFANATLADERSRMREVPTTAGMTLAGNESATTSKVYIVQLKTPSAAQQFGSMTRSRMARPAANSKQAPVAFSKSNAAVQSHAQKLENEQNLVLNDLGGSAQKIYSYKYSLNGFAARMTPLQADKLRNDKRVLNVWEDEIRPLATRTSPLFLGLFDRDVGLRGTVGLDGDGIVIGVIDSGIAPGHPSLQDTVEADRPTACQGSWGKNSVLGQWLCRKYDIRDDEIAFEPPENWNGSCQAGDSFTEDDCNNKVIGARYFVEGAQATLPIDSRELMSPADVFGHGTHVATIAAGNKTDATIFGTALGNIEGIAPKARIAVYKACWIRAGENSATCNTSDLANAIDTAVADGVHVINYSVGSSLLDKIAPDDLALIAAAKAGIVSAVAAGNEGPNLATIGSPSGNAAVITVAASTREGNHSLEAMLVNLPAVVAGRYAVKEASFTPLLQDVGPIEAELILVDDGVETLADGTSGTSYDGCETISNVNELSGKIAFMERGGCDFDIKVQNAETAGAIAALVFNISGDPIVMTGDDSLSDIPALMIGQADGQLLFDELDAGTTVDVVLEKGLLLEQTDDGNVMAAFSARGPGPVDDILKPDVTAPGVNILAGSTPLSIVSVPDENFAFLSGTSMSTPHVAGVLALLRQAHPDWSAAALKSALMTTARQDVKQADETTDAHPFDFGSGHIDANPANDPGLVYDMTDDDYDAYSCSIQSPDVSTARCDELTAGGQSLEAADVNLPSIALSNLANTRTITRRVTNVSDSAEAYSAQIVAPDGIDVQVNPSSISVSPGQTVSFDVSFTYVSGGIDLWRFGSLTWQGSDHDVRTTLAIKPTAVDAPDEVSSFGGSGSLDVPVTFGYNGGYTPVVHGLDRESFAQNCCFVDQDPTQTFSFREGNGVTRVNFVVDAEQLYTRFALRNELTDGDDDLDMYVYYSADYDPVTQVGTFVRIGESGNFDSDEEFGLFVPPAGVYSVFVHGFDTDSTDPNGPGANFKVMAWQLGLNDFVGNMSASGPTNVSTGSTENVTLNWTGLSPDAYYLGVITHNTPAGVAGATLVNIRN